MNKYQQKHIITLSSRQRQQLQGITRKGDHNARVIKRAQVLLKSDEGFIDKDIAPAVGVSTRTVENIRKRFSVGGIEQALYDQPRSGQPPKIDDTDEAHLVALACSTPKDGEDTWTLEALTKAYNKGKKGKKRVTSVAIWYRLDNRGIKPWREKNVVYTKD